MDETRHAFPFHRALICAVRPQSFLYGHWRHVAGGLLVDAPWKRTAPHENQRTPPSASARIAHPAASARIRHKSHAGTDASNPTDSNSLRRRARGTRSGPGPACGRVRSFRPGVGPGGRPWGRGNGTLDGRGGPPAGQIAICAPDQGCGACV